MKTVAILTMGVLSCSMNMFGQNLAEADEHRPLSIVAATVTPNVSAFSTNATITPATITLDGIANLNYKCALLTIRAAGQLKKSFILKEGETQCGVEVLQINLTNALVLLRNAGNYQTISLNGFSSSNSDSAPEAGHAPLPLTTSADAGEL